MFKSSQQQKLLLVTLSGLILIVSWSLLGSQIPGVNGEAAVTELSLPLSTQASIASGRPNEDISDANNVFWIGYDQASGLDRQRTFLKFQLADASQLPITATIESASLTLYLVGTTTNDKDATVAVQRVLTDTWLDTLTWAEQEAFAFSGNAVEKEVGIALDTRGRRMD